MDRFCSLFNDFRVNGEHCCLLILHQLMQGMHLFSPNSENTSLVTFMLVRYKHVHLENPKTDERRFIG